MKLIRSKKGFTLLEVVISIAIIAAIALPLLSIFVQSVKTDRAANDVFNANYISQDYIERLDAKTYYTALNERPNRSVSGDYYLSATIKPYGTINGLFDTACDYVHFVCYDNEKMLAVMPDGKWHMFNTIPNNIALLSGSSGYLLVADDYTLLTGSMAHSNCAVIINAMKKVSSSTFNIILDDNFKSVLYCRATAVSEISITGESDVYPDMITGETSLIHVATSVYNTAESVEPVATAESYINITNWLSS